jgi:hypothetical protein
VLLYLDSYLHLTKLLQPLVTGAEVAAQQDSRRQASKIPIQQRVANFDRLCEMSHCSDCGRTCWLSMALARWLHPRGAVLQQIYLSRHDRERSDHVYDRFYLPKGRAGQQPVVQPMCITDQLYPSRLAVYIHQQLPAGLVPLLPVSCPAQRPDLVLWLVALALHNMQPLRQALHGLPS